MNLSFHIGLRGRCCASFICLSSLGTCISGLENQLIDTVSFNTIEGRKVDDEECFRGGKWKLYTTHVQINSI